MRESVTPVESNGSRPEFPTLMVEWNKHYPGVGIGLEQSVPEGRSLIWMLMGNDLEAVGTELLRELGERGWKVEPPAAGTFMTETAEGLVPLEPIDPAAPGALEGPQQIAITAEHQLGLMVCHAAANATQLSTPGIWSWFDRPAMNRLVRLVRRARTEVFGADE